MQVGLGPTQNSPEEYDDCSKVFASPYTGAKSSMKTPGIAPGGGASSIQAPSGL
jgi:hypothetical protein